MINMLSTYPCLPLVRSASSSASAFGSSPTAAGVDTGQDLVGHRSWAAAYWARTSVTQSVTTPYRMRINHLRPQKVAFFSKNRHFGQCVFRSPGNGSNDRVVSSVMLDMVSPGASICAAG